MAQGKLSITTVEKQVIISAHSKILDKLELVAPQIDICHNEVIVYLSEEVEGVQDMGLGTLIKVIAEAECISSDYTVEIKTLDEIEMR